MKSSEAWMDGRLGYEFDGFVLDPMRRRLERRDGNLVELTPRVFDALLYFVEHPGELLDRERLFQALWPGLVVEDNNLSQVLSSLRRALGDEQNNRYVLTVPRRGFRFVCAVREVPLDAAGVGQPEKLAPAAPTALQAASAPSPDPDVDSNSNSKPGFGSSPSPGPGRRWRLPTATVAGVLLLLAAFAWLWQRHHVERIPLAAVPGGTLATLAVLPFKPLLAEHRDEILELGMADSLIVRVSPTSGLVVRSIGSVRRFAGTDQDPLAAARLLDVQWILDGTLQRWGDRVRVTARLLSAADGVARWSGSFDERFVDVFQVQDRIAERVALLLIPQLGGATATAPAAGTRDADAYQLYLTARYHAQGIRPSGLAKGVELFQRAIERDPGYALAHAGLADALRRQTVGADAMPGPALSRARAAAQRAIEIDPGSADGHAALGWVQWWHDWDWAAAEKSFRRAIALNPNVAEAHLGLGHLLLSQQRQVDEGLRAMRRARELDPLSRITNALEASYLMGRGQRDEGLMRLNKALEIDPDFWPAQLLLASVQLGAGQPAQALATARRAEELSEGSAQATARLAVLLARSDGREEARAVLQRLLVRARERYVPPTLIAEVHCALDDRVRALDALERAQAVHDIHLLFVKITPCLTTLQGEPRFDALLKTMALPPGSAGTGKL